MKKRDLYKEWLDSLSDDEFLVLYNDLPFSSGKFAEWLKSQQITTDGPVSLLL